MMQFWNSTNVKELKSNHPEKWHVRCPNPHTHTHNLHLLCYYFFVFVWKIRTGNKTQQLYMGIKRHLKMISRCQPQFPSEIALEMDITPDHDTLYTYDTASDVILLDSFPHVT